MTIEEQKEIASLRADRARLDWLEKRRVALNAHCGSAYGWEVVQSHLVNRLMLRTPEVCAMAGVDVNDTGAGGKDIRHAIDDAMRASSLANVPSHLSRSGDQTLGEGGQEAARSEQNPSASG